MLIPFQDLIRRYNFHPEGVLHIGANVGEERNEYHNMKAKKVVWIEANEQIYQQLKKNLEPFPNQEALNYCIGDVDGKHVGFNVSNNGSQSSSILELGTHKQVHPEVKYINKISMQLRRIDKIDYDFSGLDFLNIDLQGAELLALKGMGDLLDQFKYAYLEVNWDKLYKDCPLLRDIQIFMKEKGFEFKEAKECGNTKWGDAFWMK